MNTDKKTLLAATNLSMTYKTRSRTFRSFEHHALKGLTLEVKRGETLGILGRNGCGKSSLLRILAGIVHPTSGQLELQSGLTRSLLTLGLGFRPDLSGRDNAILSAMLQGKSKKQAKATLETIQEFAELGKFFHQPVRTYSAGMRARLGFATALKTDVDVLLIDEVLSVGDTHFKHKAEQAMLEKLNGHQTVVFVSHNAGQIDKVCNRAIWIEGGVIRGQGNTKEVAKSYRQFMNELDKEKGV
ncbi:ABC transporter ATP-binding protein [Saccharospirillum salsuginis]|uniref:ABC transporter domain-containing protein n=1 Tax=Saccharospirillum salsuginis TaxID=418750 RepID=A0A918KGG0_9GAMM|nr:ATP-binding cassette domain-containing protein [Saccharospirillum salsuginis]GGX60180.1 hypothetical protein GCM10007392_30250 [Saccharospirillum salsuginis]